MSDKDIIDMKEENGQWSAYVSEFSPEKLWEKIKGHAKKVGCEGIRSALRLFYALDNPSMPLKTKMVIYGALGYFISPIDVIPISSRSWASPTTSACSRRRWSWPLPI